MRFSFLGTVIDCDLLQGRYPLPPQSFPENAGLMAAASPVLQLGLLHMWLIQFWLKQRVQSVAWCHGCHRVTVTRACVSALARWRDPFWLKRGIILDTPHRRKFVTTDASNKGWGALCEGKPTFGLWSEEESGLHINCLEMLSVCQACQFFPPDIQRHHVLIRSDSRSVVSYINYRSCLVLKWLCTLANDLLVWAQSNMRSLKAMHVLWSGRLGHAFPPVALLPQVLRRAREQRHKLILIPSPPRRNQPLVSELFQLLKTAPWLIPLRPPLSSEWHAIASTTLHVWPLDGSLSSSQSVS